MRRKLFIFVLIVSLALQLCTIISASAKAPAGYVIDDARGGYIVYTAQGLFEVAGLINKGGEHGANIFLGADIDIAGRQWTPLGISPEQCYTGIIDGQGHALRGLTVEQGAYAGLIGYADGVCVKDLTLENVYIEAENNAACVIARAEGDVTITDCTVSGYVSVKETVAAGLVGSTVTENIFIEDCIIDVDITGESRIAQAIGYEGRGASSSIPKYTLSAVIALGSCTESDMTGENYTGSLVGYFNDLELNIEHCIAFTDINAAEGAGGLIGTARCGSVSIIDTVARDSLVGTFYPDVRGAAHSYESCSVIKDGAASAPAIEKLDLGSNTVSVSVNGNAVQPADASVSCVPWGEAIGMVGSDSDLAALAGVCLGNHTHKFSREVASPLYLDKEAQCPTKNTYFKSCICGEKGTETFVAGNRAMHLTKFTLKYNSNEHWYVCDVCKDEDAVRSAHIYTTWQSDGKRMTRACRVCDMIEQKKVAGGGCGAYMGTGSLVLVTVAACAVALKRKDK